MSVEKGASDSGCEWVVHEIRQRVEDGLNDFRERKGNGEHRGYEQWV